MAIFWHGRGMTWLGEEYCSEDLTLRRHMALSAKSATRRRNAPTPVPLYRRPSYCLDQSWQRVVLWLVMRSEAHAAAD